MRAHTLTLAGTTPGQTMQLAMLHFGTPGTGPKIYIQAGLHADEAPGMLAAHHLRQRLTALEEEGRIASHIVLVPMANPIGLSQSHLGTHHGRFAFSDGANFNRGYPDLTAEVGDAVAERLTQDGAANVALIRAALLSALEKRRAVKPADSLKQALLREAVGADLVLDLHCDGEGEVHLYTLTGHEAVFQPLADRLGARAMLVAEVSGDNPFDEAVSRPWRELAARFPAHPIPAGAMAATVELRGEADVSHAYAASDAEAILQFLAQRGHVTLALTPVPGPGCTATPLAGSEALEAPVAGLVVYRVETGTTVSAGTVIADIINPLTGEVTPVSATADGVFYARHAARFAMAGRRIGKIAGRIPFRNGLLLSP
jgi:uncharacterized protein